LTRTIDLGSGESIWQRPAVASGLSPDGLTAAVYPGSGQRGVDLVDVATGETIRQLQAQGADPASVAFSADSSELYTTGYDGKVRAWDVHSGEVLMTLTGSGAGLSFPSPDSAGTRLAAADDEGTVLVWDLTVSPLGEVMAHSIAPAQVAQWGIDTEAGLVAAVGFAGRCPDQLYVGVVVDATSGEEVVPAFHDVAAQGVALSDDGTLLLHQTTFPFGPGVPCSERADGTIVAKTIGGSGRIALAGLCDYRQPSSLLAIAGTPSGNGECPFPPELPYAEFVTDIDIGPDGQVVAGGQSSVASIWEQADGGLVRTLGPHAPGTAVQGVALDPSSGRVAVFTVGAEQRLDIYSASGETIETIRYEPGVPVAGRVVFSPEGRMLAVGADRLTVYDTSDWNPMWEPADAHDGGVGELDFSPNGQNIVTTGRDGFVRVWEAASGGLRHTIPLGDDFGKGVGFVDDTHIVVGTQNGLIATFTIDIEELARIARDRLTREMSEQECMTYLHRSCASG
jgi:WD40 repeat protein